MKKFLSILILTSLVQFHSWGQLPFPETITVNSVTSNQFTLNWSPVDGAVEYQVYIGMNPDTASIEENDSLIVVANENLTFQVPEYSELYYYFVRSIISGEDTSSFSPQASIKLPVAQYLEQDSLAMVSLYENANGENWINAQNWLSGKLNTWEGLVMEKDSLKAINLPSNQINGEIPNAVGELNFVEDIDLSFNSITDIEALQPLINDINFLSVSENNLSFEQLEPFNIVPIFEYFVQDFNYTLPEQYVDTLGAEVSIELSAPASSNFFQWYKDSTLIDNTDSVLVLNNLQEADEGQYYVEVRNDVLTDLILYSTISEVRISTLVPAPENITVDNITSNQFALNWDPVNGAEEYQVYIGMDMDTASIEENDSLVVVSNNSLTYQAPQYSELYYYYVRAISSSGDTSSFSPQASIKLPVAQYLEQDSLAMVSLYENTNGENWNNSQNWLTGKLNTWEGLVMETDSLKAINLPSNQINGEIPNEVGGLNFVEEIDLSLNSITDIEALQPLINDINFLSVSENNLSFEQLEPFNIVPIFEYFVQDFNYTLPEQYVDTLGAEVSIELSAPASSNFFQWYKDSTLIDNTDSVLVLNNLQNADEGTYFVEVRNDILTDLILYSTVTELKVSTLERDVAALREFYESTNGAEWTSISWDTSSDNPEQWSNNEQDIIVENNRVVEINLPDNNLSGSVPEVLNEIVGLRTLDLSNNDIQNLPNLSTLLNLSLLDVSGNALGYDDLEPNIMIDNFIFNDQANFGDLLDQKIPKGSPFSIEYMVDGSNNTYQWYRNNELDSTSSNSSISYDSLTFELMGEYKLEVRNEIINSVDPDFTLESNPVQIIAIANISGSVVDANDSQIESGRIYLFNFNEGQAFDSVLLDNGQFFENIEAGGVFTIENLELGDYILFVDNNDNEYPELLNTYFPNTIDWETAEVISLRGDTQDLEVTMEGEPQTLEGTSNFSGYLEEEFEEGERNLPRRRMSGVGVSTRRLTGSSREITLKDVLENNELVAYTETDQNGEFEFPNLSAGSYTVKFDIPGVPMDEQSDVNFELTGEDQESLEVSALSDNGKISVRRVKYTSNKSELLNDVSIYPNPSTGRFVINGTESIKNIKVINAEGRTIQELSSFDKGSQKVEIDISNKPEGMYFLQIVWKDGLRSMNKIIKE